MRLSAYGSPLRENPYGSGDLARISLSAAHRADATAPRNLTPNRREAIDGTLPLTVVAAA